MKNLVILLLVLPMMVFAQEENKKRASISIATSQGTSFVLRGANIAHNDNPFSSKAGYSYKYTIGVHCLSKSNKGFSDFTISYRSDGTVLDNIVDTRPIKNGNIKAYDRFNYVSFGYSYGRYLNKVWGNKTFINGGLELSYVLNRKTTTKYSDGSPSIEENIKGSKLSWNYVVSTSPTFLIGYGIEFNKPILGISNRSQLSIDLSYDYFFAGQIPSIANNNFGMYLTYKILL